MAARALLLALAAMASTVVLGQDNLNTFSWMATYKQTGAACVATWEDMQAKYYSSAETAACGVLVKKAMDTYVQANCPGGPPPRGDAPGGELWNCMTGNGTNTDLKNAWVTFVKGCEIFYIAYRFPTEAESGFRSKENSCLRKFSDTPAFKSYLDTRVNTGAAGPPPPPGAAESTVARSLPVVFAFVAAAAFLLLI